MAKMDMEELPDMGDKDRDLVMIMFRTISNLKCHP